MIKKILLAAAVAFALIGGVSLARADECQFGSFEETMAQLKDNNVTVTQITDADLQRLIDQKGPPPNAKEGVHMTAHLAVLEDVAAIYLFQEGCLINRLGPAPKFIIQQLFGQVEADTPVQRVNYAAS